MGADEYRQRIRNALRGTPWECLKNEAGEATGRDDGEDSQRGVNMAKPRQRDYRGLNGHFWKRKKKKPRESGVVE